MKKTVVLLLLLGVACTSVNGSEEDKRLEYKEFRQTVEAIIRKGNEAAQSEAERADLRTLQWLLREYNKHVEAGDWKRADQLKGRMKVALYRSGKVVDDGPRRKAEQERADQERRHRELVKQRDRQHRETMNQRERQHREWINQVPRGSTRSGSQYP